MKDKAFRRRALNLANAIEQQVGWWRCYGRYCLIISGSPQIPKPTSSAGKRLVSIGRAFIDKTGSNQIQVCEELLKNEEGSIMIQNQYQVYTGRKVAIVFCDET